MHSNNNARSNKSGNEREETRMRHFTSGKSNFRAKPLPTTLEQHNLQVEEPWITFIAKGQKYVEGRLLRDECTMIQPGHKIVFNGGFCTKKVVSIQVYKDFTTMIEEEGLENVLPGVKSVADGVKIYYQFYTPADEQKYGVVALRLENGK